MTPALASAWGVFTLFLIPIGGGIPAGVLLAKTRGIPWPVMMALYFVSDLVLAVTFEPLMLGFVALAKKAPALERFAAAMREATRRTIALYGSPKGHVALVLVAFGVDPMTGRAAALAAGHGFVTGWMIAIAGDMMYFTVLMVSTLWLSSVLGDGTWTMVAIVALMVFLPRLWRRARPISAGPTPDAAS
jgi:hypothetical protein